MYFGVLGQLVPTFSTVLFMLVHKSAFQSPPSNLAATVFEDLDCLARLFVSLNQHLSSIDRIDQVLANRDLIPPKDTVIIESRHSYVSVPNNQQVIKSSNSDVSFLTSSL
jgi:hypothetical protein